MRTADPADPGLRRVADLLGRHGQTVVMMTLGEDPGLLVSRPMTAIEMDASGRLWFMTSRGSAAAHVAADGSPVNLAWQDAGDSQWVSVAGRVWLVDDADRRHEVWSMMARPWFDGPDDPDLVLLCVQPEQVDIWDGPHGTVSRVLAMAASVAAGREVGLGRKETHRPG